MRVTPDDPHHAALEQDVIRFAEAEGWTVGSATYHAVMAEPVRVALQRCWDPAALYVRARADRVAVRDQQCVLFEAKSNSGRWIRAAIEANPICHYVRLGVPCLYVYRDIKDGFEAAFWTTALPEIDTVFLPQRWPLQLRQYFKAQFRTVWPDTEVVVLPMTNGSDDPFVVISRESLMAVLVDWRAVFRACEVLVEAVAPARVHSPQQLVNHLLVCGHLPRYRESNGSCWICTHG